MNDICAPHPDPAGSIGIFDSGIGGYPVFREIRRLLPAENLVYVSDSAHIPYGSKSAAFIRERCFAITDFLLSQNAKAVVIACNTATSAAATELRREYPLPIIAMEPGVKPAIAATRSKTIGVLATEHTLAGDRFRQLLNRFAGDVRVIAQPCPQLVEQIERGNLNNDTMRRLLEHYALPLLQQGADTLILGCTHYVFVRELLQDICGDAVTLIDTGRAVAQRLHDRLRELNLLAPATLPATDAFWTSGSETALQQLLQTLGAGIISVRKLPQPDLHSLTTESTEV